MAVRIESIERLWPSSSSSNAKASKGSKPCASPRAAQVAPLMRVAKASKVASCYPPTHARAREGGNESPVSNLSRVVQRPPPIRGPTTPPSEERMAATFLRDPAAILTTITHEGTIMAGSTLRVVRCDVSAMSTLARPCRFGSS
jgi:hypothetical protein